MSSETITKSTAIDDEKVVDALGEPVCFVAYSADGSMKAYHVASKVASVGKNKYSGFLIYKLNDGGAIAIGKPKEPKGLVCSYYEPKLKPKDQEDDGGDGPSDRPYPF